MQVKCPSCNAGFSLDVALNVDASRSALFRALQMPSPLALLWAQYMGLFRAPNRALAADRADRLMADLLPMLESGTVERNGNTRQAGVDVWKQALEQMVDLRNVGKLTLPLKSHGYLLEIVFATAERGAAKQERGVEETRKRGAQRDEGLSKFERIGMLSQIRGDFEKGLIASDQAEEKVRAIGYPPEALYE